MKDVILLKLGYNYYAFTGKAATAGKLLELLSEAVEVHYEISSSSVHRDVYRAEAKPLEIRVEMIERSKIIPPKKEEADVELPALHGGLRLLKASRK